MHKPNPAGNKKISSLAEETNQLQNTHNTKTILISLISSGISTRQHKIFAFPNYSVLKILQQLLEIEYKFRFWWFQS